MARTQAGSNLDGTTLEGVAPRLSVVEGSGSFLTATLLSHADISRIGDRVLLGEFPSPRPSLLSRLQPYFVSPRSAQGAGAGAPLGDRHLSREPLRIEKKGPGIALYQDHNPHPLLLDGRPIEGSAEIDREGLERGVVLEIGDRVALLLHLIGKPFESKAGHDLIGASDAIERLRERISQAGPTPWPVLVRGETGSGKDLVAQAIHRASRRAGPYLAVNMAALPAGLAAAELFGARRGAFTNATADRPGLLAAADGGTLFLDEIGEASEELQTLLLRCLETGEILPIGSAKTLRIDVRWIAATDAKLEEAVEMGRFRSALLHRLAGLVLEVPPLRRRRDDIPRLLMFFICQELEGLGKAPPPVAELPFFSPELARRVTLYAWPGNVRELRNFARNCIIEWQGGPLEAKFPPSTTSVTDPEQLLATRKPNEVEREEVLQALQENNFEIKAAAATLGVSRTSLYALLEKFGLKKGAGQLAEQEIAQALIEAAGNEEAAAKVLGVSARALKRRLAELANLGSVQHEP